MATIDIPDKLMAELRTIAHGIATQDNRATASPYYYKIRQVERIYGLDEDYCTDGFIWVGNDDTESHCEPDDLPEDFDENNYHKVFYKEIETFQNCFLTEAAIQHHIKINRYHYADECADYLDHAFRNPEMESLFELFKIVEATKP